MPRKIANPGDTIEYSFSDIHPDKAKAGKTFAAKVLKSDWDKRQYEVTADYGADTIPFSKATLFVKNYK